MNFKNWNQESEKVMIKTFEHYPFQKSEVDYVIVITAIVGG